MVCSQPEKHMFASYYLLKIDSGMVCVFFECLITPNNQIDIIVHQP